MLRAKIEAFRVRSAMSNPRPRRRFCAG